jgi:hypothetical protein
MTLGRARRRRELSFVSSLHAGCSGVSLMVLGENRP